MLFLTLRRAKKGINRATRSSNEYGGGGMHPGLENGVILRERRESMGVTIDEVETATKIRHKYLAALEGDDWQLLPGEIVGRGFLRNYASFLDLDPNEMIERRRALADVGLARILRDTSAVSPLPPERQVDYRPKEVELKDEPEGLDEIASQQRRRRRRSPFLGWLLLMGVLLGLLFWQASNIGSLFGSIANGVQSGVAAIFASDPVSTAGDVSFTGDKADNQAVDGQQIDGQQIDGTNNTGVAGVNNSDANSTVADGQPLVVGQVDPNNVEGGQNASGQVDGDGVAADSSTVATVGSVNDGSGDGIVGDIDTSNNDGAGDTSSDTPVEAVAPAPTSIPPTDIPPTPVPVPPTEVPPTAIPPTPVPLPPTPIPLPPTPIPLPPTPVPVPPTPIPLPPTPVPAPVAAAPSCPDARSTLTSPGVNEIVSGAVPIVGSATHEAFQYYKLEFAPGANAAGGYNYFDGTQAQISNGRLGQLNTSAIPNGTYTIRLTTVDATANFPPPCTVTIQVQN